MSLALFGSGELSAPQRVAELVFAAHVTHVVGAVAELDLAGQLPDGPRTAGELAAATGADPDGVRRLARAATALGLLESRPGDRFALTAVGACLGAGPGSLRDLARMHAARGQTRPAERTAEAIRSGHPVAAEVLGEDLWSYYRAHPEEGALFDRAMTAVSAVLAAEVAGAVDLGDRHVVVDVGGGHGLLLARLLAAGPGPRGVVLDRSDVVAGAPDRDRVDFVAGDFFAGVPTGDAYLLCHVVHDWNDEAAERILRNCRRAASGSDPRLLVVEMVLGEEPGPALPELLNVHLLSHYGGRERTRSEFARLMSAAGWRLDAVTPLASGHSVLRASADRRGTS